MRLLIGLLLALTLTQGCVSETSYGQCEGLATEDNKKPDLVYRLSAWNLVVGIIFIDTVFVPIYVVGWSLWCPVGAKA